MVTDVPITVTCRNLSSAHQKRMKSGTDVDIDKYLRGTHEFVYNNTKFEITNPTKKTKK